MEIKLAEILQYINLLQSKLSRVQNIRARLKRGEGYEEKFNKYTEKIKEIHSLITYHKLTMAGSNVSHYTTINGMDYSLMHIIIEVGVVNSELQQIQQSAPSERRWMFDDEEEEYEVGEEFYEKQISELEQRKRQLQNALNGANWSQTIEIDRDIHKDTLKTLGG